MTEVESKESNIQVFPATAGRWADLEGLFGKNGAYSICWCMFWRVRHFEFNKMPGEERKSALRALAESDQAPGVLAYRDGEAVGWCSIGPREDFAALEKSRILKRVDDLPVWSIVCFYVKRPHRRLGVARALVAGAVEYAVSRGAKIIESYPLDMQTPQLQGHRLTGYSGYIGIASIFRESGFREVGQASEVQLIMRYIPP
jgi:GNAT superfamily N-acetyltransferase